MWRHIDSSKKVLQRIEYTLLRIYEVPEGVNIRRLTAGSSFLPVTFGSTARDLDPTLELVSCAGFERARDDCSAEALQGP